MATFDQPLLEQRSALDHIARAEAAVLGFKEVDDGEQYYKQQMDKALGHLYRGFFDAADWFSISIRDAISKALEPYSQDCIQSCIPTYFSELNKKLISAEEGIAAIRGNKDIVQPHRIIEEVEDYNAILNDLLGTYQTVSSAIPAMIEYKKRSSRVTNANATRNVIIGVLVGVILGLLTWIWNLIKGAN